MDVSPKGSWYRSHRSQIWSMNASWSSKPRITFQYWETITFKPSSIVCFWMTYLKDISNLYPEILATFCSEIIWATEHLVNVLSAVSIAFRSTASWCEFVLAFVGSITGRLKIACSSPVYHVALVGSTTPVYQEGDQPPPSGVEAAPWEL